MTDRSLSVIRPVIQFAKQAGFASELIAAFIVNCNLAEIGKANPSPPFNNVKNFINDAHIVGVLDQCLISLTDELNWETIGKEYYDKPSSDAAIFTILFLLHSGSINKHHIQRFLNGFGWINLQLAIDNYYSAEAISALRVLLFKKAELTIDDLHNLNIDLRPSRIWRNSFLNRPVPIDSENQKKMRSSYLTRAEYGLRGEIEKDPDAFFKNVSLQQWNILLRNLEILGSDLASDFAIPALSRISSEGFDVLISESDLKNIGIFLKMYSHTISNSICLPFNKMNLQVLNFDEKLINSDITSISHFIFSFNYIDRPDKCHEYALQLEAWQDSIIPIFSNASLREIDFFIWNYWMSLPKNHFPVLFNNEIILEQIRTALNTQDFYRVRAGIVGTLMLSTGQSVLIGQRDLETIQGITRTLLHDASIQSIRIIAGMMESGATDFIRPVSVELLKLIDSFSNDYSIENQPLAIQKVQVMLLDACKNNTD
jgi:hypothetical protein